MKNLRFLLLSVSLFWLGAMNAQTSSVKFYEDEWLTKETSEKKAKYSATVLTNADGSSTTEVRDLRNKVLLRSESYKGEEPVGKWLYDDGKRSLDYGFFLDRSGKKCQDTVPGIKNSNQNHDSLGYRAAVMGPSFFKDLSQKINYPPRQRESGIGGKVFLQFTVTESGAIENISVLKGAHPALDKEAARVLRESKFQSPAMSDGKPVRTCMVIPISFKIQ